MWERVSRRWNDMEAKDAMFMLLLMIKNGVSWFDFSFQIRIRPKELYKAMRDFVKVMFLLFV